MKGQFSNVGQFTVDNGRSVKLLSAKSRGAKWMMLLACSDKTNRKKISEVQLHRCVRYLQSGNDNFFWRHEFSSKEAKSNFS